MKIIRYFTMLFFLLTLVFLNDGRSHDQLLIGPYSYYGADGYEKLWAKALDMSVTDHLTVGGLADARKTTFPILQKWSLDLSGSAQVYATGRVVEVVIKGKKVKGVILPQGTYYIHAHIKKKNAQGEFKTVKTGDNDTVFVMNYSDEYVNEITNVFLIHICNNKFDLDNYQVDVKGTSTNTEPHPDQDAEVSLTL